MSRLLMWMTAIGWATAVSAGPPEGSRSPVLLELFTSEGCSSCPPADQLLESLEQRQPYPGVELIVLSEHVEYWNHLGWRDPFSLPAATQRQTEYGNRFHLDSVYTPQLVINGEAHVVGSDARGAGVAIAAAAQHTDRFALALRSVARQGSTVNLHIEGGRSAPASTPSAVSPSTPKRHDSRPAVLYVALVENRVESQVGRGENSGRRLTHVSVMRSLTAAGRVSPTQPLIKDMTVTIPEELKGKSLHLVAFVQDTHTGRILGVTSRAISD